MAFFDELTKKAKDVAAVAADRAKDAAEVAKGAAEVAKINMAIAGEQREIDKNYRTIGEWFVSEYEGQIPDAVRGWRPASPPGKKSRWWRFPCRRSVPSAVRSLTASSAPTAVPRWVSNPRGQRGMGRSRNGTGLFV